MPSILDRIIETKWKDIARAKESCDQATIERLAKDAPPPKNFLEAIRSTDSIRLIAEVKKASPSKGIIREDFHPVWIAQQYQQGGAHALSILTDESYFQGSLDYLKAVRSAVDLPLLRKDFIVDPYQVYEARAAGADAVLLIAECLQPERMRDLYNLIRSMGMYALIELYDERNLEAVLDCGTEIVGVNNRDLHSFEVDLNRTIRLRPQIPADRCLVGESGISMPEDVARLWHAGVQAILVGESLMRQQDICKAVQNLLDD